MKDKVLRFLTLAIIIMLTSSMSYSQTGSWNYTVTGGPSSPKNMTGATVIGAGGDDVVVNLSWPFSAIVYDDLYTVTDNISINSNGVMRFDAALYVGTGIVNLPVFPSNNTILGQAISYGGNTDGRVSGNFEYKVTGVSGSRVLTIAFTYYTHYSSPTAYHADIQLSYYEVDHHWTIDYSNVGGSNTPTDRIGVNAGDGVWGAFFLNSFPTQDTSITLMPGASFDEPASFTAVAVSSNEIDLSWTKNSLGSDVIVAYNTSNTFGNPVLGTSYSVGSTLAGGGEILYVGGNLSMIIDTIPPGQTRYYRIWSKLSGSNYYSSSFLSANATTFALDPPTPFTVSSTSSNSIDLSWVLNSYSDSVIITYNTTNTFTNPIDQQNYIVGNQIAPGQGTVIYKGIGTSFTHSGLSVNTQYFYQIWSFNDGYFYSLPLSANGTTSAPLDPSGFTAQASGTSIINLAWSLNASGNNVILAYNTVNSFGTPQTGAYIPVGNTISGAGTGTVILNSNGIAFSHTGLNPNTVYYYKLWSYDNAFNYSSGVTANDTTDALATILDPQSFSADEISASTIKLTWQGNVAGDSVMIVVNTANSNFTQPQDGNAYWMPGGVTGPNQTIIYRGTAAAASFLHTGLNANTKYYYKIWSYNNTTNYYSTPGLLDSATTMAPGISNFPYIEDFESQVANSGNISGCQTYFALTTGWQNVQSVDDIDWIARTGSTPSWNTGPSGDNTTAAQTGKYLYTESSACNNKEAWLVSPLFNFTNLTNPQMEFYYHMYGSTMGQLSVQVSTDGGTTWSSSNLFYKSGQQHTSSAAAYSQALVNLGAYAGMSDIKIRIKGTTGTQYRSDMAIDDIKVYEPTPMSITSVTTEQDTLPVVLGQTNQQVIRVRIDAIGDYNFLALNSLSFNTSGTQNMSDISNAKVFYTGNLPEFSSANQFGTTTVTAATFNITGSQVLSEGPNYFWLSFDIPSSATIGNLVDAACTSVTISSSTHTPTVTSPPQIKMIVGRVIVGTGTSSEEGPVYRPWYHAAHEAIYLASELGGASKEIKVLAWEKASGSNIVDQIDQIKVYMKNSTASTMSTGTYSLTGYTLVYSGPMTNNKVTGWVEVPLSNPFLYDGTSNIHVLVVQTKPATTWSNYPFYRYSITPANRVRRAVGYNSAPTNLTATNHRPNIRFEYVLPVPMVFSAARVIQPNVKNVGTGDVDQEIIGIKITTQHTGNPLSLTKLDLSTLGSTAASDIANAKVYYTGSDANFAATSQFGSTKVSPSGTYSITGTQTLIPGDNYFWVTYDVSATATVNNVLDAQCTSVTITGTAYTPLVTNPVGNRKIKKYITIGNITSSNADAVQPVHSYQYHGWEAIYTATEMGGTAKDLTGLAFYKKSGADITHDIQNITIYAKHTTSTTLSTGSYSLSGYTQVFSGSLPNDALTGWMQVPFTTPFAYNGTDNIEFLIVQGQGAWFVGGPLWSYNTVSPNRARYANNWSSQPTTLNAANRLASIRLEYEPPQPMVYVSTTTTQGNVSNIVRGIPDQEIIGIQVVTSNSANPLNVTSFNFSTNGSTNASVDISKATVYYTGNSPSFAAINPMGVQLNPNGTFTITGNQTLTSGINYFWLAYDLPASATIGNYVDAECLSVTVDGSVKTPSITSPVGNRTIVGALSGYYTIGTGGDYPTFAAAVSALNTYGVSDWVTFRVFDGTYNEQVVLSAVNNASTTRPITFESFSKDSSLAVLTHSNSNSARATLIIDGASYYIIRDLTIEGSGYYSTAIELKNNASSNVFRNNIIKSTGTQAFYSTGVMVNYTLANNNKIIKNNISTNGYGVYLRGLNQNSLLSGIEIDSNIIYTKQYGVYSFFTSNLKFRANNLTLSGSNIAYGLYLYYSQNAVDVSFNKFSISGSQQAYGLYFLNCIGTSSNSQSVYNNFVSVISNSSTSSVGIYTYLSSYQDIYFNNVNVTATSSTTKAGIYIYGNANSHTNVKNNNASCPGGAYSLYYFNGNEVASSDYNNLFTTGNVGYYGGTVATNLASWKTISGADAHSISMDPQYNSSTDLHIGNLLMDNLGTPISGITTDIDDSLRNATTPDIGADEYKVDIDAELVAIVNPSPSICGGNENVEVTLKNNGFTTLTSATIDWSVGGVSQTSYSWTGSLAKGASQNVVLGSYNFSTLGNFVVYAKVNNPNGQIDQIPVNDSTSMTIVVNGAATVDAGPDDTICSASSYVLANATGSSYSSVQWTTSGTGTFTNATAVNTTYIPSSADMSLGSVTLKLSAIGLGSCGNDEDSMILTMGSLPVVSFSGLASDYCDNAVATSLSGTPANGTFSGNGISGSQFDPSVAGFGTHMIIYSVALNGCIGADTQYVDVHETPIADAGSDQIITPPATSATLNGSYTGGTNVGYFWSPAALLNNPNIASPTTTALVSSTTYTLETKDTVNQCSSMDQVDVIVGVGNLVVTATANPSSICEGDSTALNAVVQGGSGVYTYTWTSVPAGFTSTQKNPTVYPNVNTTYNVAVNDGTSNAVSSISVTVNPIPSVTFSGLTSSVCSNGSALLLNGTPAGGTFTSTASGLSASVFDPTVDGAGIYNVYYTYTDASGCSNTDTQTVVIDDAPIADAGTDVTINQGHDTIVYGSATGGANYQYNWTPVSMLVNPNNQTPNDTTVILYSTQTYNLTVVDTVTACQSSDNVTVTVVGGALSVNLSADKTTICEGDTVNLSALASGGTGNYTYTWTSLPSGFTSTIANPQVTPTVTTVYNVVLSDGSATTVNASITITVKPVPAVSFGGLAAKYCQNAIPDTLFGVPNGGLFIGSGMAANIFDPSVAGVGNHTITYTYMATNGCTATASQLTTVYDVPVANAGTNQSIASGTSTTLNATATGGTGTGTYSWDWSPASLLTSSNVASPTTVPMTLSTIFTLVVTDTNQCSSSDNVTINVGMGGPLTLNPQATPDTICAGQQVQLNALVGGGSGSYLFAWTSNPSGFIDLTANPVVNPSTTTTYYINVFDGTNTITDSVKVVVGAIPIVSISGAQNVYCDNGINDTLIGLPSGGTFFGTGMINDEFSPVLAGVGAHQIIYKYTSSFGCSNSDTVDVNVVGAPVVNAGSDIIISCGGTGGVIGTPSVGGLTYLWSPTSGLVDPNAAQTNANPSASTLYTLTVTDQATNCKNTDDVQVDVTGAPQVTLSNDTIICAGNSVTISASGGSLNNYLWSNGVTTASFTVSPMQTTVYTVVVSDTSSCTTIDSVVVTVNNPNLFLGPDITIVDTSSIVLDAGFGYVDYDWSTGDTTQSIIIEPYINAQLGINKYSVLVTDVYGCQASDSIYINYVLSVVEASKNVSFGIYPNPTKGIFNVVIEGTVAQSFKLDVLNLEGRLIESRRIYVNQAQYTEQFDLSTYAKGVYIIRLMNEGVIVTKKLIVQ